MNIYLGYIIMSITVLSLTWAWWRSRNKVAASLQRKPMHPPASEPTDDVLYHPDLQKLLDAKTTRRSLEEKG